MGAPFCRRLSPLSFFLFNSSSNTIWPFLLLSPWNIKFKVVNIQDMIRIWWFYAHYGRPFTILQGSRDCFLTFFGNPVKWLGEIFELSENFGWIWLLKWLDEYKSCWSKIWTSLGLLKRQNIHESSVIFTSSESEPDSSDLLPPWAVFLLTFSAAAADFSISFTSALPTSSGGRSHTDFLVVGLKKKDLLSPVHTMHQGVPGTGVLDTGRDLS